MRTQATGDDDATIVALLQQVTEGEELGWGSRYVLRVLGMTNHQVDVEIRHDGRSARIRLALPSSRRPMPWLTPLAPANHFRIGIPRSPSAGDWVDDLLAMLNEEMDTGGIAASAIRTDTTGHEWMIVEGYGLRSADSARHQRLRRASGPYGLYTGSRRRISLQYALEWALDQAEEQLAAAAADRDPDQFLWRFTSPDGVSVTVIRSDHDHECDLLARSDRRCSGRTAARRITLPRP